MEIELTDDGTMDTVLRCSECGAEMRYNYEPPDDPSESLAWCQQWHERHPGKSDYDADVALGQHLYDAFVKWAIEDATADHVCEPRDDEPTQPQEDENE